MLPDCRRARAWLVSLAVLHPYRRLRGCSVEAGDRAAMPFAHV